MRSILEARITSLVPEEHSDNSPAVHCWDTLAYDIYLPKSRRDNRIQSKVCFGSYSSPCFLKMATNSSSNDVEWWCRSWFWMYAIVSSMPETPILKPPYPSRHENELMVANVS